MTGLSLYDRHEEQTMTSGSLFDKQEQETMTSKSLTNMREEQTMTSLSIGRDHEQVKRNADWVQFKGEVSREFDVISKPPKMFVCQQKQKKIVV